MHRSEIWKRIWTKTFAPLLELEQQKRLSKPLHESTIVVGMSGGVDSAVSAYILKQSQLFKQVKVIFMHNWDSNDEEQYLENQQCTLTQDWEDVQRICHSLNIETVVRKEFIKEYWLHVFEPFIQQQKLGTMTPNPDIFCNQFIKFDKMLHFCKTKLGADFIATGHYSNIHYEPYQDDYSVKLERAFDKTKDQSYFLSFVNQNALKQTIFPIGNLSKKEHVRSLAEEIPIMKQIFSEKQESMGICFIGEKKKFSQFLSQYIDSKPGDIITNEGKLLGQHKGLHFYTCGQNLRLGGLTDKWFVYDRNAQTNQLLVCQGTNHPLLFHNYCIVSNLNANTVEDVEQLLRLPGRIACKIRYNQPQLQSISSITKLSHDTFRIQFEQPIRAIAPGQICVFYLDQLYCIGGAVITESGNATFI